MRLFTDDERLYVYKLVLLGDRGVGKSNLVSQFLKNKFIPDSEPTIGVDFYSRSNIYVDNKIVKCQIWDIGGDERIRHESWGYMLNDYCKGLAGALIVYDITRKQTFENVKRWVKGLRECTNQNSVAMLIGNKVDLGVRRAVSVDEAKAFSEKENMFFMETSTLDAYNVEKAFIELVTRIYYGKMLKASNDKYELQNNDASRWVIVPKKIHETSASQETKTYESSDDTTHHSEVGDELDPQEPQCLPKDDKDEQATSSTTLYETIKKLVCKFEKFNTAYEEVHKEKIQLSEKALQDASEREDFIMLTTSTDHLTGATLQAAEMLKEKVTKKYGF